MLFLFALCVITEHVFNTSFITIVLTRISGEGIIMVQKKENDP
jgi:hypothetical protein